MVHRFSQFSRNKTVSQIFRYGAIGLINNFLGYVLYIFITNFWEAPKLVMSLLYFTGVVANYFANQRFTFSHKGSVRATGFRYLVAQFLGYFTNFILLVLFVDVFGFSHQIVQAVAILVVALLLFVLLRSYVFVIQKI
jgi:putative flippase GtrA